MREKPRGQLLLGHTITQLAEAMLGLAEVADGPSRRQLISLMDPMISGAVPEADTARAHVVGWLRTCAAFDQGRANLVEALTLGVPDTAARTRVLVLIDRLWPAN